MLEACILIGRRESWHRTNRSQAKLPEAMDEMGNQTYVLAMIEEAMPELESVSSLISTLIPIAQRSKTDGLFRRHVLTRTQFRAIDLPGRWGHGPLLLKNHRKGNYVEAP